MPLSNLSTNLDKVFPRVIKHRKYVLAVALIGLLFLSYSVSQLVSSGRYNAAIWLLGPLMFVIFWYRGIKSIVLVFILACYLNYFVYLFNLPEFMTWYVDICAMALIVRSVYSVIRCKINIFKPYFAFVLLTLVVHLASFIINNIAIQQFLISLRRYYVYYSFFLALVILPTRNKYYEILIKVIAFTAFIQIPISIIQYIIYVRADFMGGLFGKNSSATISTLGIGFVFLGYYLYKYYRPRRLFLYAGFGMMIPLILAESKIAMLLLPIVYVYHVILTDWRFSVKRLVFIAMAVPIYLGAMYLFDSLHQRPYMRESLRDPLYMFKFEINRIESIEGRMYEYDADHQVAFNRAESIPVAIALLKEEPLKLLYGYGPGEASGSIYTPGSLLVYGFFPTFLVIGLLEIGIVGIIFWLIVFSYLYTINIKCLFHFRAKNTRSLWKAFCFFSNMQIFVFIPEFVYSRSFLLPYKALFFWITNGLIAWYYYNYVKNSDTKAVNIA